MITYHIDRRGRLHAGQEIILQDPSKVIDNAEILAFFQDLFPEGVGQAAGEFLSFCHYSDYPAIAQRFREIELEYLRRLKFPHCPSRFQSFFSCATLEDVQVWLHCFASLESTQPLIWKVQVPDFSLKLDALWRDRSVHVPGRMLPAYRMHDGYTFTCNYWTGVISDTPRMEIISPLHQGPVRVLEQIFYKPTAQDTPGSRNRNRPKMVNKNPA